MKKSEPDEWTAPYPRPIGKGRYPTTLENDPRDEWLNKPEPKEESGRHA